METSTCPRPRWWACPPSPAWWRGRRFSNAFPERAVALLFAALLVATAIDLIVP